ncbi:hypothetical protein BLNAU_4896 [Blattamonas nauphoetae]|uniref:Uncharacterized protein n=1 Tax=Blattamonas nauphoetae TaxID=2049346 RepID=A0ABQ9Y8C5_9EUKA|nr:hypothetical protein BLNAU_4896 [Blattamonas nauphoetae]
MHQRFVNFEGSDSEDILNPRDDHPIQLRSSRRNKLSQQNPLDTPRPSIFHHIFELSTSLEKEDDVSLLSILSSIMVQTETSDDDDEVVTVILQTNVLEKLLGIVFSHEDEAVLMAVYSLLARLTSVSTAVVSRIMVPAFLSKSLSRISTVNDGLTLQVLHVLYQAALTEDDFGRFEVKSDVTSHLLQYLRACQPSSVGRNERSCCGTLELEESRKWTVSMCLLLLTALIKVSFPDDLKEEVVTACVPYFPSRDRHVQLLALKYARHFVSDSENEYFLQFPLPNNQMNPEDTTWIPVIDYLVDLVKEKRMDFDQNVRVFHVFRRVCADIREQLGHPERASCPEIFDDWDDSSDLRGAFIFFRGTGTATEATMKVIEYLQAIISRLPLKSMVELMRCVYLLASMPTEHQFVLIRSEMLQLAWNHRGNLNTKAANYLVHSFKRLLSPNNESSHTVATALLEQFTNESFVMELDRMCDNKYPTLRKCYCRLRTSIHASITEATFLEEPSAFLSFDRRSKMSLEDKATLYRSLISLIRTNCEFDDALQDRAAQFLRILEPRWSDNDLSVNLISTLVPSPDGSPSGFIESIITLLSSPRTTIVAAALSFLFKAFTAVPPVDRCRLVESDLIRNVLATVQPHTLPISRNNTIIAHLIKIIEIFASLTFPYYLDQLDITTAVDQSNHREMIFQKVVFPSSQFVTFLISNRYSFNDVIFHYFMSLMCKFIKICPYHRPTLEFILTSPIVMAFSSCLSFVEDDQTLWVSVSNMNESLEDWKKQSSEVVQSGKRAMQALFSVGFEDTLEQMLKHHKDEDKCEELVIMCHSISRKLGLNVEFTEEHSSDVGNALIGGADEQILRSPPIVQKWSALLAISERLLVYLVGMGCAPHSRHCTATHDLFELKHGINHEFSIPNPSFVDA